MEDNYEEYQVDMHVITASGGKDLKFQLKDLTDEELNQLYEETGLEEARLAYRERTGDDPAKNLWIYGPEDFAWFQDWCDRNPEKFEKLRAQYDV
jgi:hypothetical protein